ncbi:MAG: class I SAM-dependent methyltransferase [Roseiflexaceae bacterium]|nr:class I SAM-dependent methyltransferase [Roseiflexaceae bacterium]
MPGVTFDRAATFYDATRGYAPGVAERIHEAVRAYVGATSETRFLEIGVGTGRIALPFIQADDDYTGVDLSNAMLDVLRAKIRQSPGAASNRYALYQADVMALPFPAATFDVVLAVHIMHLVDDRQQTIREARRVLKPGGVFISAADGPEDHEDEEIPARQVRMRWLEILEEMQVSTSTARSGWITDEIVVGDLQQLGAQTEVVHLAPYHRTPVSARQMANLIEARMFSSDWETSEADHAEATRRLEQWLAATFDDPTELYDMRGDFIAVAGRWG